MKNVAGVLIVVSLIAGFSSCQKEIDWGLISKPTSGDSTLISKVILLDTTQVSPLDSAEYTFFLYDLQKRVNYMYRLERNGLALDTFSTTRLFYNSSDTLPYKGIINYFTSGNMDELFKYYDASGRVIRDSLNENTNMLLITTKRYTYLTNRLRIDHVLRIPSLSFADSITYYITQQKNGNNILSQSDTTDYTSMGGGFYEQLLNFQYDNHPNPYKNAWHYFPFYQDAEHIPNNFSDNNFKETYAQNKDSLTGLTTINHLQFFYQYNTIGMPKIAWEKDLINGTVDKYIYFYTK